MTAQLAKQLLQIRQGNLLALADSSQRDRPSSLPQPKINHRGDRKTAFGGKTHGKLLKFSKLTHSKIKTMGLA
jgi:hypothetical protein